MAVLKLNGKSVLVTGGAGFIGSHLVDRIIDESPANLVIVDNLFLGREENLEDARRAFPSLGFYREDASEYDSMRRIIADESVEVVFNLAVIPLPTSLTRPAWTVSTNVAIATTACELLRERYYETLLHFSSSEAYGSAQYVPMDENHPLLPATPYAASKAAGDFVVLSYRNTFGIDAAIIRPFNNYGPRQNKGAYAGIIPIVIAKALRGEPITIYGDGTQTRDFVFVTEVANAAILCYEQPATRGKVINVASGREIAVKSLVRTILEIMGADVPVLYGPPRAGDILRHKGDTSTARKLMGFYPATSFEKGIENTVKWYCENAS